MDNPAIASGESPKSPGQPNLLMNPEIEAAIDLWQQTGAFPFTGLPIFPQPEWHSYSKSELRLIHHVCSITQDMMSSETSKLTIWAALMPR